MQPRREPATKNRPQLTHFRPTSHANRGATKPITHNQTYDVHSGQVFKEVKVHANKRQRSDWIGEFKTPNLVRERLPNANGARSLFEMAKGTAAEQMRSLSSRHLSDIPWEIVEQVWNEVIDL
jgi:hypothetical protein